MGLKRAGAGAVAIHVALLASVWLMPDRPKPTTAVAFEGVEVVLLDRVPESRAQPDGRSLQSRSEPVPPPDASSDSVEPEPREPEPPPRRDRSRRSAPSDDSQPGPVAVPREPVDPGGTKVALGGLRDARSDDVGTVFAPTFDPGAGGSQGPAQGPSPAPRRRDDTARSDAGQRRTPRGAGFVRRKDGRMVFRPPEKHMRWSAELLPDGRVQFTDHTGPYRDPKKGQPLRFKFATAKELGAKAKGIQFWLKAKKQLLAETAPMRLKMAEDFAEANIERELAQLGSNLVRIWKSHKPPRTRRGLLFELWDECEEPTAPGGSAKSTVDTARRGAGRRARARIVAFIQRNLPEGAQDGYPAAELVGLNKHRVSRGRFDPYRGG